MLANILESIDFGLKPIHSVDLGTRWEKELGVWKWEYTERERELGNNTHLVLAAAQYLSYVACSCGSHNINNFQYTNLVKQTLI